LIVAEHFARLTRCDEVLRFFIVQRLTGKAFHTFWEKEQGGSILEAAKFAIKKINKDLAKAPIIAGRDFL
jgi:hypothetical protein